MHSGILSRRYQLYMSSGTLYRVALVRSDVSEKISPSFGLIPSLQNGGIPQETSLSCAQEDTWYLKNSPERM
jgi:hypothetical protein